MIDFVHVTPDAHIDRVEFLAPDSGEKITVLGLGPSVHADFPIGRSISSKQAEGFADKVTAEIEKGVIQQLMGNSMNFGSPLKLEHLETIKKQMAQAFREYHERTRIIGNDNGQLKFPASYADPPGN